MLLMAQSLSLVIGILLAVSISVFAQSLHECDPYYNNNGRIHIGRSLTECSLTMSDPYQPITHVQDYVDAGYTLNVLVKLEVNNLIAVDELENTASLDFFYRLWWQDVRWNFTQEFWSHVPISVYYDGIELYSYIFDADSPLPLWKPDLHFVDAKEVDEFAALLKLRPGGQFYWSRHLTVTIMQADFYLKDYPSDSQNIKIVFESYGFTQGVMGLTFQDPPVGYITDKDSVTVFSKNPIWFHNKGDYTTTVYENDYTDFPEFPRIFVALEISFEIERAGRGILVRYALPILILLLLSAATFWADPETRIDTTMTILLSVSALYVVIIQGIPQVGYLTTFDSWIFIMYTSLAMGVVLHQLVIVLKRKTTKIPLRRCLIRLIEFLGRVFTGPLAVAYYMVTFMDPDLTLLLAFSMALSFFVVFIAMREWGGLKKSFVDASESIIVKVEKNERPSKLEKLVMNLVQFKRISVKSTYCMQHLARKHRSKSDAQSHIEMKGRMSKYDYDSDDDE